MLRRSIVTLLLAVGLGTLAACSPPTPSGTPTGGQSTYNPLTGHHEGIFTFCALVDGWVEVTTGHSVYVQLTEPGGVQEGTTFGVFPDFPFWQAPSPLTAGECFSVLFVDTLDQGPFWFNVAIEPA
ncbi:MAG TPA: hypothetical protein VJM33_14305 [Microthrixaceae bacterium]|nr:hypothetical protein [Microthrixaceae bacterium]